MTLFLELKINHMKLKSKSCINLKVLKTLEKETQIFNHQKTNLMK